MPRPPTGGLGTSLLRGSASSSGTDDSGISNNSVVAQLPPGPPSRELDTFAAGGASPVNGGGGAHGAGGRPSILGRVRVNGPPARSSFASINSVARRHGEQGTAVDLCCQLTVKIDEKLNIDNREETDHTVNLLGMRSAADMREAIQSEVRASIPENEKYRVVEVTYGSEDKDLEDLQDMELRALSQGPLHLKAKIGLESNLLLSVDLVENDEGEELFDLGPENDNFKLTVHVACGKGLLGLSRNGTSDPFVQISLRKENEKQELELVDFLPPDDRKRSKRRQNKSRSERFRKQTKIIKRNNINPQWDEDLSFDIPISAVSSRQELEGCILFIDCYSADSVLSSQIKRTTNEHLIGSTTVNIIDVLETIGDAEERENDELNGTTGAGDDVGDWYTLVGKPVNKSRMTRMGTSQAKYLGKQLSRMRSKKPDPEPAAEQAEEEVLSEEEEINAGELQLSFTFVEPDESEPKRHSNMELELEPELHLEPEPEPQSVTHQASSPLWDGKIEVEIVACRQILAPHKKSPAKVYVTMALSSSTSVQQQTEVVQCTNDVDPSFGGGSMREFQISNSNHEHTIKFQVMNQKRRGSDLLGEAEVDLRQAFEEKQTSPGHWDTKVSLMKNLSGAAVPGEIQSLERNQSKVRVDSYGYIEVKLRFVPDLRASGPTPSSLQSSNRATVHLGMLPTPTKDESIAQLMLSPAKQTRVQAADENEVLVGLDPEPQPEPQLESQTETTSTQNDEEGLLLQDCTVEVLLLGARELVSKPRKAKISCEYLCQSAGMEHAREQSFRILESSHNPTFTIARSDLERKSASKLRKMVEDSSGTVFSKGTQKEQLVQAMLDVPVITIQGVPFMRSRQTTLKLTIFEQPFMRRGRNEQKEFGSASIKLCKDPGGAVSASQDEETKRLWQDACDAYIRGVVVLCESSRENPEVTVDSALEWWNQRLQYNKKVADETLGGLILLWWSIHSRDGKVKNEKLVEDTWKNVHIESFTRYMERARPGSNNAAKEARQKDFLKQLFGIVPSLACVDSILNSHMELRRPTVSTAAEDRRIYKHDAQKWWERNSVRSAFVFEAAWAKSLTGASDFITAGQFHQLIIKLLVPSEEDLRTALSGISTDDTGDAMKQWFRGKLDLITSESSRPKGKSELRSLLLDENRLTSYFEQHADAAGPSESEYITNRQEHQDKNKLASLVGTAWMTAAGLDAEESGDTSHVRIDVDNDVGRPSIFDSFLLQWRELHDMYGSDDAPIPRIEEEWVLAWNTRNNDHRMTRGSMSRQNSMADTHQFVRQNLVTVLEQILALDDSVAEKLFRNLDVDSSGSVDKDDALHWFEENAHRGGQLRFELAWTQADLDCSNNIDFPKFKTFVKRLLCPTQSDVDVIINEMSGIADKDEAADALKRRHNETATDHENRLREFRNNKRRQQKEAKERRDKAANDALVLFKSAKDKLDCIDTFPDEQQLLDFVANVENAIRKAEGRQQTFSRVVFAPWEKGRKYLPTTWEASCKGGMVPFFPRYLLSAEKSTIEVEGEDTMPESASDYETDSEHMVPRTNTGAIRCAFRVTTQLPMTDVQEAEDRRWQEFKALMSPHPVVIRVYVIEGSGLRAMSGNSSSTYLECSLGKQSSDTKARYISKSLNPEWREVFEFDTILPGPAVLQLHVKHRTGFSKDKAIGATEIDLERRYFCEQWRRRRLNNIETRPLNAKGLKQLAKRFGNSGHGQVKLWVDIVPHYSGSPLPPPINITRPPTEPFQLRLIIWHAENIPLQGSNASLKCHNMSFSAHMRTTEGGKLHEEKKETDTHWRARNGRGNFNFRMIFDFDVDARLPVKQPCLLTLKCWDKEPLRLTNKLIGYKEVNISGTLESALEERLEFIKRQQKIDDYVKVGNVQELQKLLDRFREQNKRAEEERNDKDRTAKLKRSELTRGMDEGEYDTGDDEEEDAIGDGNNVSESGCRCCTSCCSTNGNFASAINQLSEDKTEIDVLQATHEYRTNNVRCLHLNMMGGAQDGAGDPMVWATVEVLHKSLANERQAGDGRQEPNEHPILEEPEREKIGIRNVMGSLSVLVGAKYVKLARLLIGVILLVLIMMEIAPQVSSQFAVLALRKGLPLPCSSGFERAKDVYKSACGKDVYGAWRTVQWSDDKKDKLKWQPPFEENVLECLGPENCGGMYCLFKRKNENCKTTDTKWFCFKGFELGINDGKDGKAITTGDKPFDLHDWESYCGKQSYESKYKHLIQAPKSTKDLPSCARPMPGSPLGWWDKLGELNGTQYQEKVVAECAQTVEVVSERTGPAPPVEKKNRFNLYQIDNTKYRYAVDIAIRRTFYHDNPGTYSAISDPALRSKVERLVSEKCRYGGSYYNLVHYGTDTTNDNAASCDELRENGMLGDILPVRWLRQDGLDGWFWKIFSTPAAGPDGPVGQGMLTTPLLMPWEINSCATVPCPKQCIAVSAEAGKEGCPVSTSLWPVRVIGRLITGVVVPILLLRLAMYVLSYITSCLRCPKQCRGVAKQWQVVRRSFWFVFKRAMRKFKKLGSCAMISMVILTVICLYFFSQ